MTLCPDDRKRQRRFAFGILVVSTLSLIGFFVVSVASVSADITSNLVGHWKFDEGSGTTASDWSFNGNTGTLMNNPPWVAGKIGAYALSFNGTTNWVSIPHSSSLNISSAISVSVWMKVASHNSNYREIVRKGTASSAWFVLLNGANKLAFASSGSAGEFDNGYSYPADNAWHLVTATFDGSTIRLYHDGVLQTQYGGSPLATNSNEVSIGQINGVQFFAGSLDDVRIYSRALSAGDVSELYAAAGLAAPANLTPTVISSSQINLTWSASAGANQYKVYRCPSGSTTCPSMTMIQDVGSATSYSDTGLTANTSYSYEVKAFDSLGNSSPASTRVSATTFSSCSFTISPVSSSVSSNNGTGTVGVTTNAGCSWTATSNAAWISSFSGTPGTGSGTYTYSYQQNTGSARTGTVTIAGQTFTLTQSAPACAYSISPTSSSITDGSQTGTVNITVGAGCAWTSVSNTPAWLSVVGNPSGTGTGVTSFFATQNTSGVTRVGTLTIAGQTHTVTQAAPGLAAPANLTPTVISSSQINLTWSASAGANQYKVYRCPSGSTTCPSMTMIQDVGSATSYSDTGLAPSTSYSYEVKAFDIAGNSSPPSTRVSATTQAGDTTPPSIPANLTASAISSSQINLSWTASTDTGGSGLRGYKLYRCTVVSGSCSGSYSQVGDITSGTSYSNTGLPVNTTYRYYVFAYDWANNNSSISNTADATTPSSSTYSLSVSKKVGSNPAPSAGTITDWYGGINCGANCSTSTTTQRSIYLENSSAGSYGFLGWTVTGSTGSACSGYQTCTISAGASGIVTVTANYSATDTIAPEAPHLDVTVYPSVSAILTWSGASDNNRVSTYSIYRCSTSSSCAPYPLSPLTSVAASEYQLFDASLSQNTTYRYQVTARDQAGNVSSGSNIVTITTPFSSYGFYVAPPYGGTVYNIYTNTEKDTIEGDLISCGTYGTTCDTYLPWKSVITVFGIPDTNYYFAGWGGPCAGAGTTPLCTLTLDSPLTTEITATFLPRIPIVNIGATPNPIISGTSATLTWQSYNATSCTASGAWSGSKPFSGTYTTGNLTANTTYTLTCTGPGGSTSKSRLVGVTPTKIPLSGWAWSDTIGWISLSCENNSSCATVDFGLDKNADGTITGFAWSNNIGWIKFGGFSAAEMAEMPTGSGTVADQAKVDGTGKLTGWARACAGMNDRTTSPENQNVPNNSCQGWSRTDGWDGWIGLSGSIHQSNLLGNSINDWMWGSSVVGWVFGVPSANLTATSDCGATNSPYADLSWNAVLGATQYYIYRSDGAAETKFTFNSSTLSYRDEGLAIGGFYSYQISSFNGTSESQRSESVFISPNCRCNTPTITSAPSAGYVFQNYNFTARSTDPENGQIRYGFDWNADSTVDTWLPSATTYVNSNVPRTGTYQWSTAGTKTYQIMCTDQYARNSAFVQRTIVMNPPPPPTVTSAIPECSTKNTSVTWDPPPFSTSGLLSYNVIIKNKSTGATVYTSTPILPSNPRNHTVPGSYLSYTFGSTPNYTAYVNANFTGFPGRQSAGYDFTVTVCPLAIACEVNPGNSADGPLVNHPVTFTALITGGLPPYSIYWTDPEGLYYGRSLNTPPYTDTLTRVYGTIGQKIITVTTYDSQSPVKTTSCTLNSTSVPQGPFIKVRPNFREF